MSRLNIGEQGHESSECICCRCLGSLGTIFVTVLAVKTLNLLWSKRDRLPWIRSKHHAHGGPSMRASAVLDTPSQLERERDKALLDLARERDALSKDLKACKVEFSHAKLRWMPTDKY